MMASPDKSREYSKRILLCRMRVLTKHPFFGLLLMHREFSLRDEIETAATDGNKIFFCPEFLDSLSDSELDFVLMHEVLHVALQHCTRGVEYDNYLFNVACDIVVNSNILAANGMNPASITIRKFGESMHIAPSGKEGYNYTAEEVYNMLLEKGGGSPGGGDCQSDIGDGRCGTTQDNRGGKSATYPKGAHTSATEKPVGGRDTDVLWDNHSAWGSLQDATLSDKLASEIYNAATAVKIQDPSGTRGLLPMCAERFFEELRRARCDWRSILAAFIDEEICDYSFSPPDRRYDSSGFFLPDYNEVEERVDDILFMIDTSGSMSDKMISDCYSEIKGAIDMFGGHLCGWLGFFDAVVVEPRRFDSIEEFSVIRPKGGGGTSFHAVFDYVREHMSGKLPVSIIILTDGYAPFPEEADALGIPVLWVINNGEVTPPFGKIARID